MSFIDDYNRRALDAAQRGSVQDWGLFSQSLPTQQPKQATKKKDEKKGNFLTSLIPAGGGIAGSLGGAAAGAAVGSAVPVVGTAIGGLIGALLGGAGGSALGKVGENAVTGEEDLGKGVVQEALLGGVTSMPLGAGLKLAKAGVKATTGIGKTGARELIEQAGVQTVGKRTAAQHQMGKAAQKQAEPLATSKAGRLKAAGDNALLSQYGTISKPFARSTDPAKTISTLADAGITKPADAERIAAAITGADGILTRATSDAVGGAGKVDTSSLRQVFNDALDNYGIVDTDRKSLQKVFDAQMVRLSGGARGSLDPKANPTEVMQMMRSLEKRIANLRGKGDNYRLSTPERMDQASVLQLVRDELDDTLAAAGADANLAGVLTPQLRGSLLELQPKSSEWASYVDDKIMSAKSVGEVRGAASPFVRVGKIIDEGDSNSITAGGRLGNAFSGGGITSMLGEAATNLIKKPASNAAGNMLRKASNIVGGQGAGAVGQGIVPLAARQTLPRAVIGASESLDAPESDIPLEQALMQPEGLAGPMQASQSSMQEEPANPTGYSSTQLAQALMKAYSAGDAASASVLKQMHELALSYEESAQSELSANQRTSLATSGNAINTLDQLEGLFGGAGGGSGIVGGSLANFTAGLGVNDGVQTYNDLSQSSVSQLAKAINGGGQVSDADAAVIIKALPRVTDSPQVARAKFDALRQRLQVAQQNTVAFGGGSGNDLASVLGGM